jgi:hypothetical protein
LWSCSKTSPNADGRANPYNHRRYNYENIDSISHSFFMFGHWFLDGQWC